MTEENNKINKINQLKVEVFDIIRQQEMLNLQFNQLQELKVKKSQEIYNIENGK